MDEVTPPPDSTSNPTPKTPPIITVDPAAVVPAVQTETDDRRRYPREIWSGDAEVLVGRFRTRRIPAKFSDVSETGARLEITSGDILPTLPNQIRVAWKTPGATPQDAAQALLMEGTILYQSTPGVYGIRFKRLLAEEIVLSQVKGKRTIAAVASGLLVLLIFYLKSRNIISFWYGPMLELYSLLVATYVLSRLGLSAMYEEPADRGYMTRLSVILSIKNEAANISETIHCIFRSHYPEDLFEVIAVDDGSTDNTWAVLNELEKTYPRLRIFRFEKNLGKRHAMALGTREAKGSLLVFMDSDSQVDPEAFYRIAQPFADDRVGAVAGHTSVIIEKDNFISKMEAVRYFVSQRIMKAAESFFGTVTCCPGPLSAYRRDAVLDVLPEWLNQTFLGTVATFGDDRSLTNKILEHFEVVYHAGARCRTYVPNRWGVFFRQQLRWKKSWVRENTITAPLMLKKPPLALASYALGLLVTVFSPLIVIRAFVYAPLVLQSAVFLPYLLGLLLVFTLLGLVYYYHTQSRYWYYGLAFALVYSWIFALQTYYAVFTVRQNHWGTR